MKVFKTLVASEGGIYKFDTIEYQGGLWLVPKWIDMPSEGYVSPMRLIRMDVLPHQRTPGGPGDYMLNHPVPRAVLDGNVSPQSAKAFVVLEQPDLKIPVGGPKAQIH